MLNSNAERELICQKIELIHWERFQNISLIEEPYCPYQNITIVNYSLLLYFYAPEIEDLVAYCFWPVSNSIIQEFWKILSETLTLQITSEQWELELRYFTRVFLVTNLSVSTKSFNLGVWPTYFKQWVLELRNFQEYL